MTIYKALAMYLKTKQGSGDFNMNIYPVQAPQNASEPYCVFKLIDDTPDTMHNSGYPTGVAIFQFDIYADTLTEVDSRTEAVKNHFVGQSIAIHADVEIAHADSQNEFDGYDDEEKLYARSFDLKIRYTK